LKWAFFVLVLYFVARRAVQLWNSAPAESIQVNGYWLIPAVLTYLIGWLPSVWFWRAMLRAMRQPLGWMDAIRAHYVGQVGKYIPGKGLVLVIRGSLVKNAGVNPILGGVTAAYEALVFMAAGAALGLALAPIAFGDSFWKQIPTQLLWLRDQPILVPLLVFALNFATTPISAWLFTRMGQKTMKQTRADNSDLPSISAALVAKGVAITSLGWFCHAISLGCVIQSVATKPMDVKQFPIWLAATTLSTVGGFVILIAPGGIGVREGLLIEVLKNQPDLGPTLAVVVAGLLRAVWFVTELITAALLYVTRRRA
jgi:uncharacterized membrane protein YbhN (UPF0104 family)